jgi:hypothetical protein
MSHQVPEIERLQQEMDSLAQKTACVTSSLSLNKNKGKQPDDPALLKELADMQDQVTEELIHTQLTALCEKLR